MRTEAREPSGIVMMSLWRLESIVSLLKVHDMSRGMSPLVATQFTTAVSPGFDGISPKLNGAIIGGTRTIKYFIWNNNNVIIFMVKNKRGENNLKTFVRTPYD